jgi:hypothetical protein
VLGRSVLNFDYDNDIKVKGMERWWKELDVR